MSASEALGPETRWQPTERKTLAEDTPLPPERTPCSMIAGVGTVFGDGYLRIVGGVPGGNRDDLLGSPAGESPGGLPSDGVAHGDGDADPRGVGPSAETEVSTEEQVHDPRRSWFEAIAELPELDDRVWDARVVEGGQRSCGAGDTWRDEQPRGAEGGRNSEAGAMGLVAVALAHNVVEVRPDCRLEDLVLRVSDRPSIAAPKPGYCQPPSV